MSEKTAQSLPEKPSPRLAEKSRILPYAIAVVVCSALAFALGYGSWFLFGTHNKIRLETPLTVDNNQTETLNPQPVAAANTQIENSSAPQQTTVETVAAPKIEGVIEVESGEITSGGGDTNKPLKRSIIDKFSIAETEVTNAAYSEFIKETGHKAPDGWEKEVFPKDTGDFPVVNISWQDAKDYCNWLGKKLGATVRLPSEAEWELAARGKEQNKYPWGNEWKSDAAISAETGGKISAVKSFTVNRSPAGAYDMAGNVWEWTDDKITNEEALTDGELTKLLKSGQTLRIVKGGTAKDPSKQISALARYEVPETIKHPHIGFRYVIAPK